MALEPYCRVLHVVDSLGPGGAQTILKVYLEDVVARGANGDSHSLYALRRVPNELSIAGADVTIDSSPGRYSLGPLLRLWRLVRARRIRVLHCHLFRAQALGYLLKRLVEPRMGLVFHEHGRVIGTEGESALERLAFRILLQLARSQVDCFVCISGHVRDKLLEVIPMVAERAIVVANPIPTRAGCEAQVDAEAPRREVDIPVGAFVVGFAGRLVGRKGWRDFLVAMKLLSARIPIFFLVTGDGPDRDAVREAIVTLGLGQRGRMLGHVQQKDMGSFYRRLDCLAMPSHWEPHGLAHLEAQSYGVPVVVSDVPGLNATVHTDEDALLFPAGDAAALAEKILLIALDGVLRFRLSSGGKVNAARFSVDAFARRLDVIYAALCSTPPRSYNVD